MKLLPDEWEDDEFSRGKVGVDSIRDSTDAGCVDVGVDVGGGIGASDVMARRASAATIPPIEWPMRIVRTDGSTVGEGVEAATSMSMTTFCNLDKRELTCYFWRSYVQEE